MVLRLAGAMRRALILAIRLQTRDSATARQVGRYASTTQTEHWALGSCRRCVWRSHRALVLCRNGAKQSHGWQHLCWTSGSGETREQAAAAFLAWREGQTSKSK